MAGGLARGDVRLYRFSAPDKERPVVILTRELEAATERAAGASAAFLDVTSQVPSGLPHPDGTQRIRNIAHELAFARNELMRAHSRMDTFLVSGIAPEDLVSGE